MNTLLRKKIGKIKQKYGMSGIFEALYELLDINAPVAFLGQIVDQAHINMSANFRKKCSGHVTLWSLTL